MHEIMIEINAPRETREHLYRALSVEGAREIPRTEVDMEVEESFKMHIMAEDLHALRAAMNSYLRWLSLALDIEEVIENGS